MSGSGATPGGQHACENPGCDASVRGHRWAQVRAHAAGWYFQKDGRAFCPDHRPFYAPQRTGG